MLVRRMGRPGLLGTMTRTPIADDTLVDHLTRLAELHSRGALSDEEFQAAKRQLLS
jgi:hypothetical protein